MCIRDSVGSDYQSADGKDLSDLILKNEGNGRNELILEATSRTAYRNGDWTMIPPYKGPAINDRVNIELGNSKEFQLYNLKDDPSQLNNLAKSQPEKLKEMLSDFVKIRGKNFSTVDNLFLE